MYGGGVSSIHAAFCTNLVNFYTCQVEDASETTFSEHFAREGALMWMQLFSRTGNFKMDI